MNKNWLKILVGISAVIVAGCAAYFSVTGLGVLFAGAAVSVMVMAGSLELAKLVAATYLKQEWDNIKGFNKWYLTISVGTLMLITSAGIFGYLSNAFQQQNLELQKVERQVLVFENKIKQNESEIARYNTQLTNQQNIRNSQENNISKIIDKNGSTTRLTQMVRNADREITSISGKINKLIQENNVAADSVNAIRNQNINLEREVGGFRFVADAFGSDLNTVVKFFIFIIVIVFDPLAVALIIAFNGLLMNKREEKKEGELTEPVIEAKDIVAEVSRLRLNENDLKKLEEVLLNPPPPNESLKDGVKKYNEELEKKVPFSEMLITDTPTPTDIPTPTPSPTGTITPTPTYLDKINVIAKDGNFFKTPAEGYTDGPVVSDDFTIGYDEAFEMTEEILEELQEENNFQVEPTEEEESRNFSTIEPNDENIFQDKLEDYKGQFQEWEEETVPEPFDTIEEIKENLKDVEILFPNLNEQAKEIIENSNINEILNQVQTEIPNESTSSEEDEKKNLIESQQPMSDLETSVDSEIKQTSESIDYSTQSQVEDLYWEKDDTNPNQVIYDLENNKIIVPTSEDEIISLPTPTPTPLKVITRNVSTRRRKFR